MKAEFVPDADMAIHQNCPCGARFRGEGPAEAVGAQAQAWRQDHATHSATPVDPGLCWHDSGIQWPNGVTPRCELRAGHAGAHECDRGSMGGSAVWGNDS